MRISAGRKALGFHRLGGEHRRRIRPGVVGGGISGLAAAYFYRKTAGKSARIFGFGQSRRFLAGTRSANEFQGRRAHAAELWRHAIHQAGKYSERGKGFARGARHQTDSFYKRMNQKLYSN